MKGPEEQNDYTLKKIATYLYERECPDCKGKRLNDKVLECKINGYNIADMCDMEFEKLREELLKIDDERAKGILKQLIEALIWATKTLKEYIKKGFIVNSEFLKNGPKFGKDYFDELLVKIKEIRASERRFYQKITDIYKECSYDYDKNSETTQEFYKNVQNNLKQM